MPSVEKVTLSLDRQILEIMAARSKKSMSEFVRDLVEKEYETTKSSIIISNEIQELRGSLKVSKKSTKERVRESAIKKLSDYKPA